MFAAPVSSYITSEGGNSCPSRRRLLYPQMFSSREEPPLNLRGTFVFSPSDGMFGAVTTPERTGPRHLISNRSNAVTALMFRATSWLGDVLTMLTAETVCACVLQEAVHQHLI